MRVTKLLALAAVAVVAVACNGISPTAPNSASLASEDASALVGADAVSRPNHGSACRDITEVKLAQRRGPWPEDDVSTVEAQYFTRGQVSRCRLAPIWSSNPRHRLIPTGDPFIVNVTRTQPPTTVLVMARAPNGVEDTIRVQ